MFFEWAKVQVRGGRPQDVIISQSAATGGNFDVVVADIFKNVNQPNPQLTFRNGEHTEFVLNDDADLNFVIV
jgi:hypothetical protein